METCTVETGLLKKKACGKPAVTRCLNCESALCAEHAIAEVSDTGKRSGKFICKECKLALKEHEKSLAAVERKAPPKKQPAAAAPKPPAEPAPSAPAQDKSAPSTLEFTPSGADKPKPK